MAFLPINRAEMDERGWDQPDFVYVIGDAYVDHSSFGPAIISRMLEKHGYKVVILPQPNWNDDAPWLQFGTPRLGFLVSGGNIDSMVDHYTVSLRHRDKDFYSDNGEMGKRPDRAVIVYCNKIRKLFPKSSICIGGVEASLRRLSHYDYWDDKVRRSVLLDSNADLLMYGMGERVIVELADALNNGFEAKDVTWLKGTCIKTKDISWLNKDEYEMLPSYQQVCDSKEEYARSYHIQHDNIDAITAKILVEQYQGWYVVQNTPQPPLTTEEMDETYALPYERTFHPSYHYIPAIEEVQYSITANRGCFGSCAFCAITHHQGRTVSVRSTQSIVEEAKEITKMKGFKGYINDIGGPTADFYHPSCKKQLKYGTCKDRDCLYPSPCPNLDASHEEYVKMLKQVRELPGIKKVFIRSGIRYDYVLADKDDTFFRELVQHHVSGQLRVAPEHISERVLDRMGKPHRETYMRFVNQYEKLNKEYGKDQYLVPYLMSSHPGSDMAAAIDLAQYLKKIHHCPEDVQDFYPTPGTAATCMYYTGLDPKTMKKVYVPKDRHEKAMQRALMQFNYPRNYDLVHEALVKAKRTDLIGSGDNALIPAKKPNINGQKSFKNKGKNNKKNS